MNRFLIALALIISSSFAWAEPAEHTTCRETLLAELDELANMHDDTYYTCNTTAEKWLPSKGACGLTVEFAAVCSSSKDSFETSGGYCCP